MLCLNGVSLCLQLNLMRILIVTATEMEAEALGHPDEGIHRIEYLVTGVGMMETTFSLTKKLHTSEFDLVINAGIAGSFDRDLKIGEVVMVKEEILSELGAEDGDDFIPVSEMGLKAEWQWKNSPSFEFLPFKQVRSVTVNNVHGNEKSITKIVERLDPQIENMEGAAVFFVCQKHKVPFIELRAISNYVERRDKDKWNIPLALSELKNALAHVIGSVQ